MKIIFYKACLITGLLSFDLLYLFRVFNEIMISCGLEPSYDSRSVSDDSTFCHMMEEPQEERHIGHKVRPASELP